MKTKIKPMKRIGMKRISAMGFVISAVLSLFILSAAAETVSITSPTSLSIGSNVTVPITVTNLTTPSGGAQNIAAFTIVLSYDTSVVTVSAVNPGDLGAVTQNINNNAGTAQMAAFNPTGISTSTITLANVVLHGVGAGTSSLTLNVTALTDSSGVTHPATINNGEVTIAGGGPTPSPTVTVSPTPSPTVSPTPTPSPGVNGTVNGTVTNATTNTPISGAVVTLTSATNSASAATDSSGQFTISIAPGTYTMTVSAPGSATSTTTITVTAGTTVTQSVSLQQAGQATASPIVSGPCVVDPTKTCFTSSSLRIIDEATSQGQAALNGTTFPGQGPRWDAQSFYGFWYDLDDGLFSESLSIRVPTLGNSQRTIPDRDTFSGGGLVYESTRQLKKYEVAKNKNIGVEDGIACDDTSNPEKCLSGSKITGLGSNGTGGQYYGKLGWMAEEFVAVNGKAKKLAKLLIEQKEAASEKKSLTVGETWQIGDYTLTANSIDAKASPRQVWLTLSWKGTKIDDKVLGQGDVYTYVEKSIAGESDVPLFVTYIDSVFAGATSDMVQLRFTWAASRDIQEIKESDIIGVFKAVSLTDTTLHLENDASVDLSRDTTVTLARNFVFSVADDKDNKLRFEPNVLYTEPGSYTERGFVLDEATAPSQDLSKELPFTWTAQSYSGFWYDLDDGLTSETLTIMQPTLSSSQRTIPDRDTLAGGGLVYESTRQLKKYEVAKSKNLGVEDGIACSDSSNPEVCTVGGSKITGLGPNGNGSQYYGKLGWMSEEYVAVNGKAKKLSKLLIEQKEAASEKKTLTVGDTWQIGDYTLTANSIDAKASPRQVWLTLSWKGTKIDDKVLGQGDVYTYVEKSIAGESDVPLFVTYIDSVFAGATTDMVQLRFTWAASRDITEVKESDIIGVFKAVSLTDTKLHLENDASIDLSRDTQVTLAGNFMFAVADDKDNKLRFYPAVTRNIGNVTTNVTGGTTETITVTPTETGNVTPTVGGIITPGGTPTVTETENATVTGPKPTTTGRAPGFEAGLAIAGLLAVAFLVLRKKK